MRALRAKEAADWDKLRSAQNDLMERHIGLLVRPCLCNFAHSRPGLIRDTARTCPIGRCAGLMEACLRQDLLPLHSVRLLACADGRRAGNLHDACASDKQPMFGKWDVGRVLWRYNLQFMVMASSDPICITVGHRLIRQ